MVLVTLGRILVAGQLALVALLGESVADPAEARDLDVADRVDLLAVHDQGALDRTVATGVDRVVDELLREEQLLAVATVGVVRLGATGLAGVEDLLAVAVVGERTGDHLADGPGATVARELGLGNRRSRRHVHLVG